MRPYLSTCHPLNSMFYLKQSTTICAGEICETSWAAALFAVVVHSLVTSQRRISYTIWTITGWGVFCPPNSTPMFCRFYSAFTEVWFRSVLRSFVIWLRHSKLNVLHSALTNLRCHCSHGHTTMASQRVGVHSSRATVPLLRYAPLTWQSGTLVQVSPWTIFVN